MYQSGSATSRKTGISPSFNRAADCLSKLLVQDLKKIGRSSVSRCIVPFEIAFPGRLLLAGPERKDEAVGMVGADISTAASEGLEPDGVLPAVFALLFCGHFMVAWSLPEDTSFRNREAHLRPGTATRRFTRLPRQVTWHHPSSGSLPGCLTTASVSFARMRGSMGRPVATSPFPSSPSCSVHIRALSADEYLMLQGAGESCGAAGMRCSYRHPCRSIPYQVLR